MNDKPNWIQRLYLDLHCSLNHPDQEPQWRAVTWWNSMNLLVPIVGILLWDAWVRESWIKTKKGQ